ncbi:hypothetical protein SETIT_8G060400v2 [Setaria italica]|uniref:Uncharacterized protein n=2 Tax=Setaria TaxID=4554 RepID=A0A368S4Q6_SETIT|nr:hypothetical protein SETIT_8G060400v2 [Setaria italica]TKV99723.1 hypothetical protein SEVIR_8G062300v2 [Setaria viridis]
MYYVLKNSSDILTHFFLASCIMLIHSSVGKRRPMKIQGRRMGIQNVLRSCRSSTISLWNHFAHSCQVRYHSCSPPW